MSNLSQSTQAKYARQWRAGNRQKRRLDTLVSDYTKVKFGNVYREAREFYIKLDRKYPKKRDLTKSNDYRRWRRAILNYESEPENCGDSSESEPENSTGNCENELERTARTNGENKR